ncbi:Reticulon [Arabidopsis suecica]|uniref:Reticulon-like protein n=1 Tax=Arabidopsis suecica TaxID=45249 RepID=A0A8T1Y2G4_ARASU|nr:Reticulon [Arabidopsis suecica]
MDPSINSNRRRRIGGTVVAAGSVWETRMQSDKEVSNNAIVLHVTNEDKTSSTKQMSVKEEALGVNGKRRTWKSRASDVKNPSTLEIVRTNSLKATRPRSIGTPPMTPRRSLSSNDSNEKSPSLSVVAKKARSESVDGIEKTPPARVKKTRSELCTTIVKAGEFDSVALMKVNSLSVPNSEKSDKKTEHEVNVPKEETVNEDSKIPEEVKEFGVCQEMIVPAKSNEDEQIDEGDHEEDDEEEKEEEVEKKSVDVKEMNVAKENRVGGVEIKKFSQFQNRTAPSPSSVRKISPPVIKRATSVYSVPQKSTSSTDRFAEQEDNFTQSQSKLQSLVDLVMWRDVSRSTLVFGFGTFLIISSSYANDLNFSFISVVAYMGLIYLGLMFVLKSLIHRGMVEEERHKVVGVREEDVKRMLRLIMPYLNESLHQLRALFSGDPSTTLKMGVVLFVLARCGSSITLWNLAKFGFLGAFTVPKIFISYSTHFSAYGNFWMRRFRDAWESCNHKKAVSLALFTLVWNLSSVTARVWAAFMLLVAFRYYQHKMIWTTDQADDDDDDVENVADDEEEEKEKEQVPKHKRAPHMMMPNKLKKIS